MADVIILQRNLEKLACMAFPDQPAAFAKFYSTLRVANERCIYEHTYNKVRESLDYGKHEKFSQVSKD